MTSQINLSNLSAETIADIARTYGLDPASKLVRENAEQADRYHGTVCPKFDGYLHRFWGCDATGCLDAANLLDGYLSEESRVMRCDDLASRDFEDRAYG